LPATSCRQCLAWLRAHPEIRLRGFHFHRMSHQFDAAAHLRLIDAYLQQVKRWRTEYGLRTLDQINVGGSIGVNYREPEQQFDWSAFSKGLSESRRNATG
jgi:diaminopimelate decarboxylase